MFKLKGCGGGSLLAAIGWVVGLTILIRGLLHLLHKYWTAFL